MLSTVGPVYRSTVSRSVKENRHWIKKQIVIPTVIKDYNKGMGGTDLQDQYNSYYRSPLKTRKWAPRIYTHFLSVSITNARTLYMNHVGIAEGGLPLFDFMDSLLDSILKLKDGDVVLEVDSASDSNEDDESTHKRRRQASHLGYAKRLVGHCHTPCHSTTQRAVCVVCKTRVRYRCMECDAC